MLALLLLVFLSSAGSARAANNGMVHQIPASEYNALLDLYNSTNGPGWADNDGWQNPNALQWHGVVVEGVEYFDNGDVKTKGHVDAITFDANQLTGTIPSTLGSLSALRFLYLAGNHLTGSIPSSLGNLAKLEGLNLGGNQLTGAIPSWPANLTSLASIQLAQNQLTGAIPSSIGDLAALEFLDLGDNQLSGQIPSSIGNLHSLKHFSAENNQLTGAIPTSIGGLASLQVLWLQNNQMTGPIPSSIGNLGALQWLRLNDNQLSGSIPDTIGNLTALEILDLYNNTLSSSIPASIGNLSSLTSLDLRNNQLTSTIPGSVGNLSALISLDLSLNQLSGSIPSSLGNLATLTHLFLGGNQLTGLIPGSFGTLSELLNLSLESNQLTGLIPSSLGGLGMLEVLSLADNQLTGPIPASLGDLGSLQYLSLAGNQLTGSIPASLGNLTALMSLDLSSNLLTGAIPASLGDLYAPSIDLAYNRLSDRVPLGVIALWPDLSHNYITLDSQQRLDFIMSGMPDEYWMPQDIPNITLEPFGSGLQIDAEGYPYWNKAAFFPTLDAFLKVTNDEDTGPIVFTLESQSDWLTIREFSVGSPPAAQVATVKLQAYGSTVFELSINLPSGSPCGTYVSEIKVLPGAFGEEPVTIPVTFYYSTQFVPLVTNGFNHKPVEGATLQVTGPLSFTAVTQANGMPWLTPVWLQGTYHYTATAPGNLASDPLNPSMGYVAGNVGVWSEVQLFEHDAPVGGTMSINEASPLKPNSELNVVLRNWTDVSAPLSYEIEIDGKIVSAKGASLGRILLTPDDPGAHTIKGRIYDAGNNVAEVTQTFTVSALPPEAPPRSAYMSSPGAAFRPYFFGTTSNTGNAADNADPDHDGHSNLLEWALMLDPTRPSTLPAVTNGIGGSPASFNALNAAATTTGGGLEFLYVRNATATAAGAVFIVEWTDTMGPLDWHTAGVTQTILSDNGAVQQVLATIPAGTGTQRFVRLRVTGPP